MIAYDDFLRADVRAGTVLAEPPAGARKPASMIAGIESRVLVLGNGSRLY